MIRPSKLAWIFLTIFLVYSFIVDHLFNFASRSYSSRGDYRYDPQFKGRDVKQIHELNNIKDSINNELKGLEAKLNQIQESIADRKKILNLVDQNVKQGKSEVGRLQREITQLKSEKYEALLPKMPAPSKLLASADDDVVMKPPNKYQTCTMETCFDYSRCSLFSEFPVYVYDFNIDVEPLTTESEIVEQVTNLLSEKSPYVTSNAQQACLYVVIIGEVKKTGISNHIESWLHSLPYWRGDGRNHLLVQVSHHETVQNILNNIDTGRAIQAQSNFETNQMRLGFDFVIPPLAYSHFIHEEIDFGKARQNVEYQVPALRNYLLSFEGEWGGNIENEFYNTFNSVLIKFREEQIGGKYLVKSHCTIDQQNKQGFILEWFLCGDSTSRMIALSQSTYVIIPPPPKGMKSSVLFLTRVKEAINSGSIPVVIGNEAILPYNEFVDWNKAAVIIPMSRVSELPYLLSSYPHADILSMRKQGRFIYDHYMISPTKILKSMLAIIRSRLMIPPLPIKDTKTELISHPSYDVESRDPQPGDAKSEFGIPPPEQKCASEKYIRNFTFTTINSKEAWNKIPGPFQLYPSLPDDRTLPTDAQFRGSSHGFRPINGGQGGSGKVYQESLGGNHPKEQFTIIMLTYERDEVLMQAVLRLKDLPHLNKVVVVWNSPKQPSSNLQWPDIGVEVAVIRTKFNSLNNRFIPYDIIETDAVLSLDDDAHLRHDEILFGFRVWRESRDRVVGFPGRFHAWNERDKQWNYNSNHTCELSMVLTGAAFLHTHYLRLYTFWMPQAVRELVDEFMNCEDIAMNFLVSHVTGKPPVKVTSRWTFRCPGCPVALSSTDGHFDERQVCINKLARIFGYMPLVFTQYRVDSVLFKTKLPHDKNKCFKFV